MDFTLTEAMAYADNGQLDKWVQAFLRNEEGDTPNPNFILADEMLADGCITGPVKMPLNIFKTIRVEKDICDENDLKWYRHKVEQIIKKFPHWDMPPLISRYIDGEFFLNDGSHRYTALKKMNIPEYYTIIWYPADKEEEVTKKISENRG